MRKNFASSWLFRKIINELGSSVGIATDYNLDGPVSNPGGDEIFPPVQTGSGALCNGYRIFPVDRSGRGVGLTPSPPSSAEGPRKSTAIPLLTLRAFVTYKKGENLPMNEMPGQQNIKDLHKYCIIFYMNFLRLTTFTIRN